MTSPLAGLKVIEMAGIGPAPFAGMLLADMGAEVVRVDRLEPSGLGIAFPPRFDLLNRNKSSLAIDLKHSEGVATVATLIDRADVLIEGFRPGVMERLGLGPERFQTSNSKLVYGRMTGWGQDGPLAAAAGHDLNYIAVTGALASIGHTDGPPVVPLNLIGDFGGGALYLAMGLLAAVVSARATGVGQTVDAAIVDGVVSLMTMQHSMNAMGMLSPERGANLIDGGAPFYSVYRTLDGLWVSVAAIEPKFYRELVERMGLANRNLPAQNDQSNWPKLRQIFAEAFSKRTRAEWCDILERTDACFAPVLSLEEAPLHPHNRSRRNHDLVGDVLTSAAAPRFSRSTSNGRRAAAPVGADTAASLSSWGFSLSDVDRLGEMGVIHRPTNES
jgi:alpha-methylacyl-CoA racemase